MRKFLKFARYNRTQQLRSVEGSFQDIRDSRFGPFSCSVYNSYCTSSISIVYFELIVYAIYIVYNIMCYKKIFYMINIQLFLCNCLFTKIGLANIKIFIYIKRTVIVYAGLVI